MEPRQTRQIAKQRTYSTKKGVAQSESLLMINTIAQVWLAYFDLDSARSKDAFAQSLIESSEEAYAATLETYRQGLGTIVELLTTDRDLANARYTSPE
jgi:outer membrane protein TolC